MNAAMSPTTIDVKMWLRTGILGDRAMARRVRTFLVEQIQKREPVTLDFGDVEILTSAFDECFGKLWDQFGSEPVKAAIHLKGLSGNNKAIFRFVLANRR